METFLEKTPCINCGHLVYNIFLIEGICPKCMSYYKESARHIGTFAALNNDICRYLQFYMVNEHKDYKNFISDRKLDSRFARFIIDTFIDGFDKFPLKIDPDTYDTINTLFKDCDESLFYGIQTDAGKDNIIEDMLIKDILDSLDDIPPKEYD